MRKVAASKADPLPPPAALLKDTLRSLFWVLLVPVSVYLGFSLIEKFLLNNPEWEAKVLGCWGTAGRRGLQDMASVLEFRQDGSFEERTLEQALIGTPAQKAPTFRNGSGTWSFVQKNLVVQYDWTSNRTKLFRADVPNVLVIQTLDDTRLTARASYNGDVFAFTRLPAVGGDCRPRS